MDQQRQVQDVLAGDGAVDASQRPLVLGLLRGAFDRPQAMLVDRVLVVLVELQQAAGVDIGGDEALQQMGLVEIANSGPSRPGCDSSERKMRQDSPSKTSRESFEASWRTTSQVAGATGLS